MEGINGGQFVALFVVGLNLALAWLYIVFTLLDWTGDLTFKRALAAFACLLFLFVALWLGVSITAS
jgi:hypothetical protein